MTKRLLFLLSIAFLLTGCRLRFGGAGGSGANTPASFVTSTPLAADLATIGPTFTPRPTSTVTPTPLPQVGTIGLPTESAGSDAYDFAANICKAEWFTGNHSVPCNSQDLAATSGYVGLMGGLDQGIAPSINALLLYPPQGTGDDTISGTYPAFTVQKGDRFRAVLTCRAHNFCDVQFGLDYFSATGKSGLQHWSYLFTDPSIVVDYPLDGIAGLSVRFSLSVRRHGEGLQAYAVWLAPHIYRP